MTAVHMMNDTTKMQIDHEIQAHEQSLAALRHSLTEREQVADHLRYSLVDHEQTAILLKETIAQHERELALIRATAQKHDQEMVGLGKSVDERKDNYAYKVALVLTLANSAYDALMVLDNDLHIIAINNSAETLFGVVRPVGQHLTLVTNSPELLTLVEDALSNEEEQLEEQFSLNKRSYRVRVQVIRRDGNFFIGIALQDVSDLVRLNRARRDMVANISHELRTPIANIRLIIDSLFHEQDKPKRKQSTSALRSIARETDSLLWLVQELLDLSMIESGQAILRMVDFPLRPLIDEVLERMMEQSEEKELTFAADVADEIAVLADFDQVRRVVLNLVHNAIKWSPRAGKISIDAEHEGDEVVISVTDQGVGVPNDQTERIFERFYQVDTARSGGEGTGLGLALCKHIVEAHSGRIWAEGNQDGAVIGGRFRFTLARAEIED